MRQSSTRLILAVLVAALSASLLIGTALAEGSVPPFPPGDVRLGEPPEVETMWVTSVSTERIPIPLGHPLAFSQSAGCAKHRWVGELRENKGGQWVTVARMKSETKWCYNGATIQPPLDFRAATTMIAANWQQVSFKTREWGGVDEWEHEDQAIGKYRKCTAFLPCSTIRTMRVNKWQWGDGDSDINAHN